VLLRETCFHDYSGYVLPRPLRGIVPPLVTPLSGPDALDLRGLERLIRRVVEAGCSGVFVLGSTGEAQALSYRLRMDMLRETCRIIGGRIPVLAGVTDTSVVESIRFGQAAMETGCDAVVTAPPYYFRLAQSDLLRHTEILAREIGAPLFLYNMPGLTKLTYEPETVAAAAQIDGVAGFKDSSGDLIYFQRVLRAVSGRRDFTVLIGPEELLPQAVQLGAHGGIAGGANLRPRLYVDLYRAAAEGGLEHVRDLQHQVLEISERVYRVGDSATSYIRGLKGALELEGVCSGLPAPPLLPLDEGERALIAAPVQTA
jgi:4-hydroxy-tetrahydrodipicolinate synthase